jgi:hypothetical protein
VRLARRERTRDQRSGQRGERAAGHEPRGANDNLARHCASSAFSENEAGEIIRRRRVG